MGGWGNGSTYTAEVWWKQPPREREAAKMARAMITRMFNPYRRVPM